MSSFEEEESDWNSSKIKGFSFGDDEETPWEELSKYQSSSSDRALASSASHVSLDSFASSSRSVPSSAVPVSAPAVVSDRVKKAVRLHQACFGDQDGLFASLGGAGGGTTISQAVGASSSSDSSSAPEFLSNDPRELRAELAKVRRQLVKVEQSRFTPIHPKETVQNIFLGRRFSLELYKSLQDKTDLIDEAVRLQCGDAITTAVVFAHRTLSAPRFLEVVSTRPVALRHLAAHLEDRGKVAQLTDLLVSLGRHEEAALLHYKLACAVENLDFRIRRVKSALQNHFHGHPDAPLVVQHLHLLERLAPVLAADAKAGAATTAAAAAPPATPAVSLDLAGGQETVSGALLYLCYHHYGKEENLLQSPAALKKMHKLSDQQYTWAALTARARKKQWKDCEELVVTKGWLGGKKAKSSVDPCGVVRILHHEGATPDVLQTFLQLVDVLEEKEKLARRYDVPNAVIDCLVQGRDRGGLERFRDRLQESSPEWFYANHALVNSNTKWKN